MSRPWILAETNYAYTRDHQFEVAVLPFGATEPHNLHLPYGTDVLEATLIGEHICAAAAARRKGCLAADDSLWHRNKSSPVSLGHELESVDDVESCFGLG